MFKNIDMTSTWLLKQLRNLIPIEYFMNNSFMNKYDGKILPRCGSIAGVEKKTFP